MMNSITLWNIDSGLAMSGSKQNRVNPVVKSATCKMENAHILCNRKKKCGFRVCILLAPSYQLSLSVLLFFHLSGEDFKR